MHVFIIQKRAIKPYVSFLRFGDYRAVSEHHYCKRILQNQVKRLFHRRIL